MLLYIGACNDIVPLKHLSFIHKTFLYVDGLPDSNYYPKYSTKECLINSIVDKLKINNAFKSFTINDNIAYINTTSDISIVYFMNTLDINLLDNEEFKTKYLQKIDTIYMSGYSPNIQLNSFPNLKTIFSTYLCLYNNTYNYNLTLYNVNIIKDYDEDEYDCNDVNYFMKCYHCYNDNNVKFVETLENYEHIISDSESENESIS